MEWTPSSLSQQSVPTTATTTITTIASSPSTLEDTLPINSVDSQPVAVDTPVSAAQSSKFS